MSINSACLSICLRVFTFLQIDLKCLNQVNEWSISIFCIKASNNFLCCDPHPESYVNIHFLPMWFWLIKHESKTSPMVSSL